MGRIVPDNVINRRMIWPAIRHTLLIGFVVLLCFLWVRIKEQRAIADRLEAYGQLAFMRHILHCYEEEYGQLPPLEFLNEQGIPCLSWRAPIFHYRESANQSFFKSALNLKASWDSEQTQNLFSPESTDWGIFNRNDNRNTKPAVTHIVAYRGKESIWDAKSGHPKSKTHSDPNSILLLWTPQGRFHPLQPGDMSEEELRQSIQRGEQILFIKSGSGPSYGIVGLKDGQLVFDPTGR